MTEENSPAQEPQTDVTPEPAAATPIEAPAEPPAPKYIEFEDFLKVDLRVGKIVEVAEHPNADRLLVLQVDMGSERRQIIAGIKAYYSPEALLGQNIVVVANLAPRKMRGLESNGMILAASLDDKSDVVVLTTEKDIAPGATCG
jgi:methionine--tRNA ligase beta chain